MTQSLDPASSLMNPVASAFPVACCGVSERMGIIIIPYGSKILRSLLRRASITKDALTDQVAPLSEITGIDPPFQQIQGRRVIFQSSIVITDAKMNIGKNYFDDQRGPYVLLKQIMDRRIWIV